MGSSTEFPTGEVVIKVGQPLPICLLVALGEKSCPSPPRPSMSGIGGRAGLWSQSGGPISDLSAATFGIAGPAPHQDSTTEPTMLAQVWVSQPCHCKHGRVVPISQLVDRATLQLPRPRFKDMTWSAPTSILSMIC